MNRDREMILVNKYPTIFKEYRESVGKSAMAFGMSCGDGWFKLIDNICFGVTELIKETDTLVIAKQVKEKLGGLRFYYGLVHKENLFERINSKIAKFMFNKKLGKQYWSLTNFRRKFYTTLPEKIDSIISAGMHMSFYTCEQCGKPGEVKRGSWIQTLCQECSDDKKR